MRVTHHLSTAAARRAALLNVIALCVLLVSITGCKPTNDQTSRPAAPALDQETQAQLSENLQQLLDELVHGQDKVRNGLLLVEGPGFRWKGASGTAFEASGEATMPDDQFAIDSVAKTMTATIAMRLVEDGRLGLDDPIGRHLPPAMMDGLHVFEGRSYSNEITVRHLLNHSSGIPDDWACGNFLALIAGDLERRWTPVETIDFVKANCEPAFPPGGGFAYSDTGYNLLGLIIESVTGDALHEVYHEVVLGPLGMNHTFRPAYEQARSSIPGRPPSERFFGEVECSLSPAVLSADWGGGGLISTTEDLNRFLRAFAGNQIFREPETFDEIFDWIDSGPFHGYGFGVGLVDFERSDNPAHAGLGQIWGHGGSSQNFMYYWPSQDLTMIGTLNQIDAEMSLYDIVASVMTTIRDTLE
jgi:CubicO group peptidase (beta-lactamase class C family)